MGPLKVLAPLMFPIEIVSHLSRIVSLSFRLFGNIKGERRFISCGCIDARSLDCPNASIRTFDLLSIFANIYLYDFDICLPCRCCFNQWRPLKRALLPKERLRFWKTSQSNARSFLGSCISGWKLYVSSFSPFWTYYRIHYFSFLFLSRFFFVVVFEMAQIQIEKHEEMKKQTPARSA